MKIGNLEISGFAALAPMAGVADRAMREICRENGAAYAVGELASAKGISLGDKKSATYLSVSDTERPYGSQLFGCEPEVMAEAAKMAEQNNPDFIEQELKQKFNWKSTERSWHFDCIIEEFKDMFYYGLLGYTETNFKLAAMVRYNLISKQDAQESIRKSNEDLKHSYTKMENMLKEYGMADSISDLKAFYQSSKYLEYSKED